MTSRLGGVFDTRRNRVKDGRNSSEMRDEKEPKKIETSPINSMSVHVNGYRVRGRQLISLLRPLDRLLVRLRFILRRNLGSKEGAVPNNFQPTDLRSFYINLDKRPDRNQQVEREFAKLGIEATRVPASLHTNGALGCALSHIRTLSASLASGGPIMIAEDDVQFSKDGHIVLDTISQFLEDDLLDVLLLANNQKATPIEYSSLLAITSEAQTTACYIAKPRTIASLLDVFTTSAHLLDQGIDKKIAAIDQVWKKLQRKQFIFAVPTRQLAWQRQGFSDIEGRFTDYQT